MEVNIEMYKIEVLFCGVHFIHKGSMAGVMCNGRFFVFDKKKIYIHSYINFLVIASITSKLLKFGLQIVDDISNPHPLMIRASHGHAPCFCPLLSRCRMLRRTQRCVTS